MAFIFRILRLLFFFVVFAGLLYLAVFVVSRLIQQVGKGLGYEVGSLFSWVNSGVTKAKERLAEKWRKK